MGISYFGLSKVCALSLVVASRLQWQLFFYFFSLSYFSPRRGRPRVNFAWVPNSQKNKIHGKTIGWGGGPYHIWADT